MIHLCHGTLWSHKQERGGSLRTDKEWSSKYTVINNNKKVNVINSVNRYSLYKKGEEGIRRETSQYMPFLHLNHVSITCLIKKNPFYKIEL